VFGTLEPAGRRCEVLFNARGHWDAAPSSSTIGRRRTIHIAGELCNLREVFVGFD